MNEAALKSAEGDGWRWVIGLAITALVVGGVTASILVMPRAVEANSRACMAAYASDLHADLAEFGQDPAWQTRYVEALQACSH
ncbi:hypothetical protein [Paraburkholderia lycopersici]|uniref:Uncharacterized protein n=1 Tax=Paraburkholderia lycopersici TaxID=416944 RepID=A0A1G6YP65_9BURK|nr:hypothetical protein [Paraburkholderia lycopersici]SDD92111.1 hypothetical protein SAMN05421548_12847 [Paraburkholderia lycopersici]